MPLLPRTPRSIIQASSVAGLGLSLSVAALLLSRPHNQHTQTSPASSIPTALMSSTTASKRASAYPTLTYHPRHATFPYTAADLTPSDPSPDTSFYSSPRFVTHIDDHAIGALRRYFASVLPRHGRILDLCSSWVSHYPDDFAALVSTSSEPSPRSAPTTTTHDPQHQNQQHQQQQQQHQHPAPLEIAGLGMSAAELAHNPILTHAHVHDLNASPQIPSITSLFPTSSTQTQPPPAPPPLLTTTTCTVSIDYLTSPHLVLSSLHTLTKPTGTVHLIISNRCFPTKAVSRWLRIDEAERLQMVGDYLWHAGWREIEIVTLCDGRVEAEADADADAGRGLGQGQGQSQGGLAAWLRTMGFAGDRCDPLWVVRGRKVEGSRGGHGGVAVEEGTGR